MSLCFIVGFLGDTGARKSLGGVNYVTLHVISIGHQIIEAVITELISMLLSGRELRWGPQVCAFQWPVIFGPLKTIHETVSSVCAHLNSVIMLIVNYLVTYKNCRKFGWYYVLDLLVHFHCAYWRAEDTGTELKPFTLQGWLILETTWIKWLLDLTYLYP